MYRLNTHYRLSAFTVVTFDAIICCTFIYDCETLCKKNDKFKFRFRVRSSVRVMVCCRVLWADRPIAAVRPMQLATSFITY